MVCAWNSSWGNKGVSMKNSVEVKNISFSYGKTEILNDLSLDIKEGEFMVLLGPSGCGKTTLLNCIAGLLDLTDGQIWIEDDNVTWKEPKDRHIGMVFQSFNLFLTFKLVFPMIEAARRAALIAPSSPIANVPTGIPLGICAIESKLSNPFNFLLSIGTPKTGK